MDSEMRTGAQRPQAGKVSAGIINSVILPHLGRHRPEVVVGPQNGVDTGVVDIGNGQVLVCTTDPLYVVPQFGWERAAWFAIHIIASDLATSGLAPQYMSIDLNVPPELDDRDLGTIWTAIHGTCEQLGVAIVTGHTGRYDGCAFPTIGGATMFAVGDANSYLTPAMARAGDRIIVTKGAAIETSGSLAVACSRVIEGAYGELFAVEAQGLFDQMSVVTDAAIAAHTGVREHGVTSMHDATERGVWGALCEVADASNVGMAIEKNAIIVQPAVARICDLFDIDPYSASSEGTLVITCTANSAREIVQRLGDAGIPATEVGEVCPRSEGCQYMDSGVTHPLVIPENDPFWPVFAEHLEATP